MKDSKMQTRLDSRLPIRSVSLQIRDCQVTVKVKSELHQPKTDVVRYSIR